MSQSTPDQKIQRLSDFKPGETLTIVGLLADTAGGATPEIMRRLSALGFVQGTRVEILRRAPLGDPVEYSLRGTRISLRRTEAKHVQVAPLGEEQ
jgi:Fe2+ transport system protein FeoA